MERAGRLAPSSSAPPTGERTEVLFQREDLRLELVLSGRLEGPVAYLQDHDEWVVLLEGRALLEIDGEAETLEAGEWRLLPAGTPHRLLETAPGSRWLALHTNSAHRP